MLQIMSMGCLDKRWNQDSVRAKRSSVCCSGCNKTLLALHFFFYKEMYGNKYSFCVRTHTCRVRICDMASKLRTLSSVAPELASWLILNNTALNFSPEDKQRNQPQRSQDISFNYKKYKQSERGYYSFATFGFY